jgi:two-component system, LytTR family, response regulator
MSLLRTVLVDDEPLALERLQFFFGDIKDAEVVGTARDGREASEVIATLKPDLVLLDVQMPHMNGLRVAATLPEQDRPEVIFVTAFEHYAADAFEVEATDYLLKPVRYDRLWQAVERAKRRRRMRQLAAHAADAPAPAQHDNGFWVPTKNGSMFVPVESIDWIEAARDYVMLHTATRAHMIRMSMRALEEKVDPNELMRVHRSAFARPGHVTEVQRTGRTISGLVLKDGAVVQVGPNYAKAVAQRLGIAHE